MRPIRKTHQNLITHRNTHAHRDSSGNSLTVWPKPSRRQQYAYWLSVWQKDVLSLEQMSASQDENSKWNKVQGWTSSQSLTSSLSKTTKTLVREHAAWSTRLYTAAPLTQVNTSSEQNIKKNASEPKSVIDYMYPKHWKMRDWWRWDAFQPQSSVRFLVAAFQQPAAFPMKESFESWEARASAPSTGVFDWRPSGTPQHFPSLSC